MLTETDKPLPPCEVSLKIRVASVNTFDWHMLKAGPFLIRFRKGLSQPKRNISGLMSRGWLRGVARMLNRINQAMKYSAICPDAVPEAVRYNGGK